MITVILPLLLSLLSAGIWHGNSPYETDCGKQPERGPCHKNLVRFYYDTRSKSCQTFMYGGCSGNKNNFRSEDECYSVCPEGISSSVENRGHFSSAMEDICRLDKEPGPCKDDIPRFFFNKDTGTCENFIYGGCQGNENNFETIRKCESTCLRVVKDIVDPCLQEMKVGGPCLAKIPRYYYNQMTKQCEMFYYGGCKGNSNNFVTKQLCERQCKPLEKQLSDVPQDICMLDKDRGPCDALRTAYYYNKDNGKCEKFFYGGCRGNQNRFKTEMECKSACIKTQATECEHRKDEMYMECGTACPLTCDNYHDEPKPCTTQCITGCFCRPGHIRRNDGRCVEQC